MRPNRTLLSCLLAALLGMFLRIYNTQAETASIGQPAPAFSIKNASGSDVTLSQFIGKTVVLEWFNPSCPFVKKFYEGGSMQKFQKDAQAKDVVWLTINSSASGRTGHVSPQEALEVAKEHDLDPSRLLLDPHGTAGKAYGARTTPHVFVVDPKGVLVYAGAIDSTPSTHSDDIPKSTNYVAMAIDAVRNGSLPAPASTEPYGCAVKYES